MHPGGVFIIPQAADIRGITDIRDEIPEDDFGLPVTELDYHEIDGIMKKYDLLALPELSMLAELERRTGVSAAQIKTNDKAVLNMLWQDGFDLLPGRNDNRIDGESLGDAMIHKLNPGCFSDLVRIIAMMHGMQVWKDNAEVLTRNGRKLSDCISTRDDVLQKLLTVGMDRERAYEIMNRVRKGRGLTKEMERDMTSAGVPDWFIESCGRIVYLFPKAHAADYALLHWTLALEDRECFAKKSFLRLMDGMLRASRFRLIGCVRLGRTVITIWGRSRDLLLIKGSILHTVRNTMV